MAEVLSQFLNDDNDPRSSDALAILKKSKERREKNAVISQRIDHALEDHWNNLENIAAER